MEKQKVNELERIANRGRILGLEAVNRCKSGHLGGAFSAMDLITVLYFHQMHIDPQNPKDPDRDRFVLSKGHCTAALYPLLAMRGYFPEEELKMFRKAEGHMSGHVEMNYVRGVDMSTGSLGQGLSAAIGMALGAKLDGKSYRVYAVMGDGEIEEGQIWEAAMAASKFRLDNLVGIVDVNGLQIDGTTAEIMPSAPLREKWAAFGWNVIEVDGHDMAAIAEALSAAEQCKGVPTMLLAHTVKGKGVSFMENQVGWHGHAPSDAEFELAMQELQAKAKKLEGECNG